jgi:hypothetical protein
MGCLSSENLKEERKFFLNLDASPSVFQSQFSRVVWASRRCAQRLPGGNEWGGERGTSATPRLDGWICKPFLLT